MNWNQLPLLDRIRWLRFILPPVLALWVVTYQLAFAQTLETAYGHTVHYGVEIAFYSLAGPVVTLLMLSWVERNVKEKEKLEAQVRRVAEQKAAVLEEERARIARDLHDGVAQTLYLLALKADMLRGQLQAGDTAADELREMGYTARKVIREVRRTIFALRPLDWPRGEFLPSLQQFITGYAEQVGWQTSITLDKHLQIPSALEPLLFRLIQESLNNVAKHANATRISVSLTAQAGGRSLCLEIHDDGQGFDPHDEEGHGLGLKQMATRTEAAGGAFQVESDSGLGTTINAILPLEDNQYE